LPSLIAFHMGKFMIVPIIFFINGLLLRLIKINKLYFFGSLVIALGAISVVFLNNQTIINFLSMGLLIGTGTGFYWANRNYLTIKETNDKNRSYFLGLLFSYATVIGLLVTFSIGWLIVFGLSYQTLMVVAFFLIIASGAIIYSRNYDSPRIGKLLISRAGFSWNKKRLIHMGLGLVEGLSFFVPSLLILTMLGNEGILGTLTALSSILSSVLIYYYGRKSKPSDHRKYFILSVISSLALSLLLAVVFNKLSILIFTLFNGLIINFLWLTLMPIVMKNIDLNTVNHEDTRFSYILDGEIFLNIGRVFSGLVCLAIAYKAGDINALRYSPILLSVMQVFLFIYIENMKKSAIKPVI
ncbi:MAG: Transporter, MFS superfamily protein, partial [Candidatus Roizmanbacteria bacterium GW2011_GWA2_35_8]